MPYLASAEARGRPLLNRTLSVAILCCAPCMNAGLECPNTEWLGETPPLGSPRCHGPNLEARSSSSIKSAFQLSTESSRQSRRVFPFKTWISESRMLPLGRRCCTKTDSRVAESYFHQHLIPINSGGFTPIPRKRITRRLSVLHPVTGT